MEKIGYSGSHEWMFDIKYIEEFASLVGFNKHKFVLDADCCGGHIARFVT